MVPTISRRSCLTVLSFVVFALVAADAVRDSKLNPAHTFDSLKDKISIESEDVKTILRLAAQKERDSLQTRSFTTKLFAILFPSSRPAINALLATAYISGPPNFLLALCPPNIDPSSLSIMVAFAVGGLLGDTFFHLFPEIFLGEDEPDARVRMVFLEPNRNLLLGVFVFIGLATFMAMDKALRIATGANTHSHEVSKKHSLEAQAKKIDDMDYRLQDDLQKLAREESREEQQERLYQKPYNDTSLGGRKTKDIVAELAKTNQSIRKRKGGSSDKEKKEEVHKEPVEEEHVDNEQPSGKGSLLSNTAGQQSKEINPSVKLAGLLNLIADFTHNITDGLALSTSFYASPALGATTTMAVFFHEIPHEVGDFALLIQSGFSKRQAMMAQFVTAIGAFLGTFIGIFVQEFGSGKNTGNEADAIGLFGTSLQWSDTLLPFTAGTFLYVGTVGVIPELLENEKGNSRVQEVARTLMQFVAMALGATIMIVISWS